MQAQENNLRKLLESNAQQYLVPLFQRFYVWKKPAWQRLWDDLTGDIATRGQGFRSPKPLLNGYFIETNLGAASIHRFCQRAVAALNLPPEAWTVKVKPLGANAG